MKENKLAYPDCVHSTLDFIKEAKTNAVLKQRFVRCAEDSLIKMSNKIFEVIDCEKPEPKFSEIIVKHRKMKITDEEFDEFFLLFFRMCAPDPKYLLKVWYNVVRLKKAMIPKTEISENIVFHE